MRLISAYTCPGALRHSLNQSRHLLIAAGMLAIPLSLQAQAVSFAGLQTTLTATNAAPVAIAIDASGNRFIVNQNAANITEVNAAGTQSTITVSLSNPYAIAVDSADNLYVADYASAHIIKVSASGTVSSVSTGLSHPTGVAVDSAGDLFIADSGNARVLRIAATGGTQTVVASGTFTTPVGLAIDPLNNLYISDIGSHDLYQVTFQGSLAHTPTIVASNLSNDPYYVAVENAGEIILSGGTDHTVTMHQVPPTEVGVSGPTRQLGNGLGDPEGLAFDGAGNVYVADERAGQIDIIAPGSVDLGQANLCPASGTQTAPCTQSVTLNFNIASGDSLTSVTANVLTQGGESLDFTSTSNTCTGSLSGPATCSLTAVFTPLAPGVRLGAVDVKGIVGSGPSAALLASVPLHGVGAGSQAGLDAGVISKLPLTLGASPLLSSVVADSSGNLYFVDDGSSCVVEKFTVSTGVTSVVAGSGACGTSSSGAFGPATSAVFEDPWRLAINGRGDLYISDDLANVIWKVDATTQIITPVAGTPGTAGHSPDGVIAEGAALDSPYALAIDGAGDLFFTDYHDETVRRIDATTGVLTTVAGNYNDGQGYAGDGGLATVAQLNNPIGLALDSSGNIFIADVNNEVIRKVMADTGIITTVAGVAATAGYTGDGGAATSAELSHPEGLATDAAGNLYIADTNNYVVRKVSASSGLISTIAGTYNGGAATGSKQDSGDGGAANLAGLSDVADVAVDGSGNFYIADTSNNALREVTPASGVASFPGYTNMGAASSAIDISVTNNGNAALDLSALTATTNFNVSGTDTSCTASTTLAAGASCVLGVEFLPTAVGSLTGSLTLTDDAGSNPAATQSLALSGNGAYVPTQVVLAGVPTTAITGGNFGAIQASIESSGGSVVTNSTASVTATVRGPGSYSQTVTASAVSGVAALDLSGMTVTTAGTYTITAASEGLTSATSAVNVTNPPATQLAIGSLPSTIVAGAMTGPVTVNVESASGSTTTSSPTASVTLTITGPGSYSNISTVAAVSGVATFTFSSSATTAPGTYTLTATSPGLTSSITTVSVIAPATQVVLSGLPASIPAGGNLGTLTVKVEAASGSVVTTASSSITLAITGPGNYAHSTTEAAQSGIATFSLTSIALTAPGTYTVTATSSGLTTASATVSVTALPAAQLAVSGIPATIAAGGNLGKATVSLEDASGSVIASSTALVTATFTGPSALTPVTAAAVNGVATLDLSGQALATAGDYTVNITSGSLSVKSAVVVTFTLTTTGGSSGSTTSVAPGAAATFSISLPATTSSYADPVTFSATGLPPGATATFSPATLTPGPAAVSTTLTIQTAAASAALRGVSSGLGGLAMGLLLLPLAASRRLRRAAAQMPMLVLAFGLLSVGAVVGLTGCGGGGSGGGGSTTPTPQTYTITVTGVSGSAHGSTTVTLTVQ